jgi:hypothetical protein
MTVYSRESYARAVPSRSCSSWEGSGSPEHLRPAGAPALVARERTLRSMRLFRDKGLAINDKLAGSGDVEAVAHAVLQGQGQ